MDFLRSFLSSKAAPQENGMSSLVWDLDEAVPLPDGSFFLAPMSKKAANAADAFKAASADTSTAFPENKCAHCGADGKLRCRGCFQKDKEKEYAGPNYCSKECQVADWKASHKEVCHGRRDRGNIGITGIKFDVVGSRRKGSERTFSHKVKDPMTRKWRLLKESDLDKIVCSGGGSGGSMGKQTAGASDAIKSFTLLTVVELPVSNATVYSAFVENCPPISDGAVEMTACTGARNSVDGSACWERWGSKRPDGRMRVKDVVGIVMERFRKKYTVRECRKKKLNKGTTWGTTDRLGVTGEDAASGTFVQLTFQRVACFSGPVFMIVGGRGDADINDGRYDESTIFTL